MLLATLLLSLQDLKLELQRFDRFTVKLEIQTEISSSDGRDSKHATELEITYECDKADGAALLLDGYVQFAKAAGTARGRDFSYEWKKGGTAKITGQKHAAHAHLEKAFKVKLDNRGAISDTGLTEYLDAFPVLNPQALLGLPCPLGSGATWKSARAKHDYFGGFAVEAAGKADGAALSAKLAYASPDTEVPVEGMINVKGDAEATGEFDAKTKRPVKGECTVKLTSAQGGLRREVTQRIVWTVR